MNWNLFWGLYILVFSIATITTWYFLYFKRKNKENRCNEKVIGKVTKYSNIRYNDIRLPVVEYSINNQKYKAVGPHFRGIIKTSIKLMTHKIGDTYKSNLTTREDLPEVLKLHVGQNGIMNYGISPLLDLYPIGSDVEIYYNPNNPKDSYVQRFIKPSKWLNLLLILGIILLILAIYIFFGPKITY